MSKQIYLTLLTLIAGLSFSNIAGADQEFDRIDGVRILDQSDIDSLPTGISSEELFKLLGRPMNSDSGPLQGFPKRRSDVNLAKTKDLNIVYYTGYWFYFERLTTINGQSGYILKLIASYPTGVFPDDRSLLDQFPDMTVDWPFAHKGKNVLIAFGRETIETIYFAPDSVTMTATELKKLKAIFFTPAVDWGCLVLAGHSDERGSQEFNLMIAERRARAVRDRLGELGVKPDHMRVVSYGEEKPAAFGYGKNAWQNNHRVEIINCSRT